MLSINNIINSSIEFSLREEILLCNKNINIAREKHECSLKELQDFNNKIIIKISDHKEKVIEYFQDSTHNNQQPSPLLIKNDRDKKNKIEKRIDYELEYIHNLEKDRSNLTKKHIEPIKEDIIKQIKETSVMKSIVCGVCLGIAPPVILNFPCYDNNRSTGRPSCSLLICLSCAREITGLNKNYIPPDFRPQCPCCRVRYQSFPKHVSSYVFNIQLVRVIDEILSSYSKEFYEFFQEDLKPLGCPKCSLFFNGISDLHHHLRGDKDFIPCPESNVKCKKCHQYTLRRCLQNEICFPDCTAFIS